MKAAGVVWGVTPLELRKATRLLDGIREKMRDERAKHKSLEKNFKYIYEAMPSKLRRKQKKHLF